MSAHDVAEVEDVEAFRLRARAWLADNLGPSAPDRMIGNFRLASR